MLSVGKFRNLSQCSDAHGTLSVLAIDHRGSAEIQKNGQGPRTYAETVAFKRRVIRLLAPYSTAVLTDPDFGMPALTGGDLPGGVGLLGPLELTDYSRTVDDRGMDLLPDWDVRKLKQAGFNGAKLVLMFHPDAPNAQAKIDLVDSIVAQCAQAQVPFFMEPLTHGLDPSQPLSNAERRQCVVENARFFTQRGVDILKMEFPLDCNAEPDETIWVAAVQELDAACTVPWTLLSAGVGFDIFLQQAKVACAGAPAAWSPGARSGATPWPCRTSPRRNGWRRPAASGWRASRPSAPGWAASWQARLDAPEVGERWYA